MYETGMSDGSWTTLRTRSVIVASGKGGLPCVAPEPSQGHGHTLRDLSTSQALHNYSTHFSDAALQECTLEVLLYPFRLLSPLLYILSLPYF